MSVYHKIRMGNVNVYLIQGEQGYILVDAGMPGKEEIFFQWLVREGIEHRRIRLIVVTHVHFDHVGSLAAIRKRGDCPVAVHQDEARLLQTGEVAIPPGTRWYSSPILGLARRSRRLKSLLRFQAVEPDILVGDEMSMERFGLSAQIIHTPGHTQGSVSILTDAGQAAVGDLASNDWPFDLGPIFNPFGEDGHRMLESWQILLNKGASNFLPAHGEPFHAEKLEQALLKRR